MLALHSSLHGGLDCMVPQSEFKSLHAVVALGIVLATLQVGALLNTRDRSLTRALAWASTIRGQTSLPRPQKEKKAYIL